MNDRDWLEKLYRAYVVYEERHGDKPEISEFIKWVFHQYGIVYKKENK